MTYKFNEKAGRYIDSKGKFVPRKKVLKDVQNEASRLKLKLKQHGENLVKGTIDTVEFMAKMSEDIKSSHIRTGTIGAGGKERLKAGHYGIIGNNLRTEFNLLGNFINQIDAKELSDKEIIARSQLYAQSCVEAFYQTELYDRKKTGVIRAKRELDANANHCPDCLNYATNGLYIPLSEIVPPGHKCRCRGNCRCRIIYEKIK